jgi:polyferredoxin
MVIMVITITTDETTNDESEVRDRMRKRFLELDELQRKREEASSAWVFVFYIGFLIAFTGLFLILLNLGIVPLSFEIIISTGLFLVGTFFMAIAFFIKGSPNLILAEM